MRLRRSAKRSLSGGSTLATRSNPDLWKRGSGSVTGAFVFSCAGRYKSVESDSKNETSSLKGKSDLRKEAAGLLWQIFSKTTRKQISPNLSQSELRALSAAYRRYRGRTGKERILIETDLRNRISRSRGKWPLRLLYGFSLAGMIAIGVHLILVPEMNDRLRLLLYGPVFTGMLAPFSFYLISPVRMRMLFSISLRGKIFPFVIFSILSLIWILSFIRMEDGIYGIRLDARDLIVILFGAITVPLLEEIFFRELLPVLFWSRGENLPGHLLAASLFAVGHMPGSISMLLLYFASGVILAFLRIESSGLVIPIFAHALANTIVTLLDFL